MNRFKKEIRKRGVKLESDYEYLPYNGIHSVYVDASRALVRTYHISAGLCCVVFNRQMEPKESTGELQAVEQRDMDPDEEMYMYHEIETWANDDPEVWDLIAEEFGKICITEAKR